MKLVILALAIVGILVRVYFVYHGAQSPPARPTLASSQGAEAASGKNAGPKHPPAAAPAASPAIVAANVERQEIEAALGAVHLTTIMPGQPGLVIIDKQEYSEGESLPLTKGRKARIDAVQDDGVQLSCNGMTFHLDAPAGPDLAAARKKK